MNEVSVETIAIDRTHKVSFNFELNDNELADLTAVIGVTRHAVFAELYNELSTVISNCDLWDEYNSVREFLKEGGY